MNDSRETRLGTIELRDDDGEQRISGYAAVFNTLSENLGGFREQIAPGAFDPVMDNDVRALFNHEPHLILGRTTADTLQLSLDDTGLRYTIDPPDTQYARDLVKSIERRDVTQSSFAFRVQDDNWDEDDDGRLIRTIREFKRLYDISPVTYPAYPDTTVAARAYNLRIQVDICFHFANYLERTNRSYELSDLIPAGLFILLKRSKNNG